MLSFTCPSCKTLLEASDSQAGAKVACTKCGQRLLAPTLAMMKTMLGVPVAPPTPPQTPPLVTPPPPPAVTPSRPVVYNGAAPRAATALRPVCPRCGTQLAGKQARCGKCGHTATADAPRTPAGGGNQPAMPWIAGGLSLGLGVVAFPVSVFLSLPWLAPALAGAGVLLSLYVLVAAFRLGIPALRLAGLDLLVCGGALAGGILLAMKPAASQPDNHPTGQGHDKVVAQNEKAVPDKPAPDKPAAKRDEAAGERSGKPAGDKDRPGGEDKPTRPAPPPAPPVALPPALPEKPLDRLVRRLREGKRDEQVLAAQEIGKLGDEGKSASRALCVAAVAGPEDLRLAALEALEKVHPALHNNVLVLLVDGDFQRQVDASRALARAGKDAIPAIPVLLAHLKKHRGTDPTGIPAFMPTNSILVAEDLKALGAMAPNDAEVLKAVKPLVSERAFVVQEAAVQALRAIGTAHRELRKEITPVVMGAISGVVAGPVPGGDGGTSLSAIATLGEFGPDAREAIPLLTKLKLAPDMAVRAAATAALKKIQKKD